MFLTVAICTRNRADSLARTLESFTKLVIPPGVEWELIIVDNGSSDHTKNAISHFSSLLPIRGVYEPTPGLSNARNRAVDEARGEYILWTDDDVIVDPNWLAAYAEAIERWPHAAIFGGKTIPEFEPPTPAWFVACQEELAAMLAARDFGDEPLQIDTDKLPFGANYALRMSEQKRFPYDPLLGACTGRNRVGEETAVLSAIMREGGVGYYVPDARVQHLIGRERQTLKYIGSYYRGHGETAAMKEGAKPVSSILKLPPWLIQKIIAEGFHFSAQRIFFYPQKYIKNFKKYSFFVGYAKFLLNFSSK